MSQGTDAEFESIIHDDDAPVVHRTLESDAAKQLRADLEPAHAIDEDIPQV
jgi:hypothetical protein